MASKTFREVVAWQKAHALLEKTSQTLHKYIEAIKDNKGIKDED